MKVGLIGWRGMVGSVLMQRMQAEHDFDLIDPTFFSTSQAGGRGPVLGADAQPIKDARSIDELGCADILISLLHDTVDREVLTANPNLKAVSSMNITKDKIDLDAATELGIPVTNITAMVTNSTADIAFALRLASARNLVLGDTLFKQDIHPYQISLT